MCRLPENTPARQSLRETLRPYTKKCGRPKLTWIEQVRNELKDNGLTPDQNFENIINEASDRKKWRKRITDNGGQPSED